MKIGEALPNFEALDQDLNAFKSENLQGKPAVVFFYPKDHTPGCTAQACAFRDDYEAFGEAGATVLGINSGSAESHRSFKEKHHLPFTLIADNGGKLRKLFGVSDDLFGLIPGRETFVFDADGKLVHRFNSQLRFEEHSKKALKVVEKLTHQTSN